jgi:hypothetical protein
MSVSFEVTGTSMDLIENCCVKVIEKVFWMAESQSETRERVLVETRCPGSDIEQKGKTNSVEFLIPDDALESYQGPLIKVTHSVEIVLETGALISNPSVRADFYLHKVQPMVVGPPTVPPPAYISNISTNSANNAEGPSPYSGNIVSGGAEMNNSPNAPSAPPLPPQWNPVEQPMTSIHVGAPAAAGAAPVPMQPLPPISATQ